METTGQFNIKLPLLPYFSRYAGVILLILGAISGYLYYWGGKPDFFETKVFAIISSYVGNRYFVMIKTNLLDEMAAVLSILGLLFIAFSKEKNESVQLKIFRIKALFNAVYYTAVLWIAAFFLIYGWSIFIFSSTVFALFLLIFIFLFKIKIRNFPGEKDLPEKSAQPAEP